MEVTDYPTNLYKSAESYAKMCDFYDRSLAALPVPMESRYVETRFGSTHMLVAGPEDAAPFILIQGMAGSAILWHHQIADFSARHRIYALDTVGQPGRSAPNPPSLLNDGYMNWLLDVLDGLGLTRAHLAGISTAGYGIIRFGIIHPERVDKAVLLSPLRLARANLNGRRWVGNAMKQDTEDNKLEDRLTAREFSVSSGQTQFDRQLARAMALATRHYRLGVGMGIPPEAPRWRKFVAGSRVLSTLMSPLPKRELRKFTAPALVVMGEKETLYNPQKAARRAAEMPNASVMIVPDAGHAAVFDRPETINPIILDFLTH